MQAWFYLTFKGATLQGEKIIAVATKSLPGTVVKADQQVDGFLTKPYLPNTLKSRASTLLGNAPA